MIGKPQELKQVNLAVVRRAIKERGSATRAEIAEATKISITTVRTLLTEMLENNEIIDMGFDDSIGGRKAVRYGFNRDRFFGVGLCLLENDIYYLIVNICGEIREKGVVDNIGDLTGSMCAFLDGIIAKMDIKSIGIGVPGVVSGLLYRRKRPEGFLEECSIGEFIQNRYNIPVFLENDLNAIAFGVGRCYLKEDSAKKCDNMNIAYIHFDSNSVNCGFLSCGRILRGWNNLAGELGMYPIEKNKTLDDVMSSYLSETKYVDIVSKLIAGICCLLNPQYIAVGGENFRKECLPEIIKYVRSTLPDEMEASIIYAGDIAHDYFEGMAYLTADRIFADIMLIREK